MDWRSSIYSDGSEDFVSPGRPALGQEVTVRLMAADEASIRSVVLRRLKNGGEHHDALRPVGRRGSLVLWETRLVMNQPDLHYHFLVTTDTEIVYYNQAGPQDLPPVEAQDFVLSTTLRAPEWVRRSVFYQIFPDRFCDGDPASNVKTGEYSFDGHPTTAMVWGQTPRPYPEVFCLDFYGGDLDGIRQKIGYLQDLGVGAIYLNPIFRSATSHRYDCLDYFHVDEHLGGDEALARLTDDLHRAGIKLIVDVSINHTGTAHRWFNKEGAFFPTTEGAYHNPDSPERSFYFFEDDNSYHPWAGVETLPTLNYTSAALRDTVYRSPEALVRKWLRPPYRIDGWRFDVANDMARKDEVVLSHEVWPEIRQVIREENPEAYVLGEHWIDAGEYLKGDEWDSAMNYYGSARPIRQFVGLGDLFALKFEATRAVADVLTAPRLARWITGHLARLPWELQMAQFNLLGSHDTDRIHNHPDLGWDRYEMAVLMLFTLPGAPNVYYGDEVGLGGTTDSNEGCRYPMEWDEARWDRRHRGLYLTLGRLKASHPALHGGGFKVLYARYRTIAWARFTAEGAVVLLASMDEAPVQAEVPLAWTGVEGRLTVLVGEDFWGITGAEVTAGVLRVNLPPRKAWLLEWKS